MADMRDVLAAFSTDELLREIRLRGYAVCAYGLENTKEFLHESVSEEDAKNLLSYFQEDIEETMGDAGYDFIVYRAREDGLRVDADAPWRYL